MNIKITSLVVLSLLLIIYLSVYVRSSTLSLPTILDYDPWYFYRYAKEIVENDYKIPAWDMLTYYPPGRPTQVSVGWPYTIAFLYKFAQSFSSNIDLMQMAKWSPLIMLALIPIPAFLLGRILSNSLGGLTAALFIVTAPIFIGVSMAGYSDTDAPIVFYMLMSIFTIFLAIKHAKGKLRGIPFYIIAVFVNLLFIYNWEAGWLSQLLFFAFIPAFLGFRLLEEMWHQKKLQFHFNHLVPDIKSIVLPLLIIFLVTNIIGFLLGFNTMFHSLMGGLGFTGLVGERLIVNISVAELQVIDIFSKSGFSTVTERVGMLPTIFTLIGLPLLAFYKIYRNEKIAFIEIFLFVWALVTFYLILTGIRFSLFFMVASSTAAGYVIGNLFNYLKDRNTLLFATVFALIGVFLFISVSNAIQIGKASAGLAVSQNWYNALDWLKENADKDSLIATWWDPGHIITGYTGLKAHADGAHCGGCVPYNHNIRIRDMGRIFSTNNEDESIDIIKKYTHLTDEQCNQSKKAFGDIVPKDACKDVTEVYMLATNDLIGKYYWMSCFGTFDMKLWNSTKGNQWQCDGKNYIQIPFSNLDKQGFPIYAQGGLTVTLLQNGTDLLAVINSPAQGVRNLVVSDVVFYQNGEMSHSKLNTTNSLDGMIWIDPSFSSVFFMEPSIRDSVFTRMFFFNGEGLDNFELVYANPEVKIFKARI
ncbi:MAG: hypothetical protein HYW24_01600 [Candidatus Aenigmarchaeota archaeon]|nr:hypothetical protein [Candidatus Aenigmarchaeota archaeon]